MSNPILLIKIGAVGDVIRTTSVLHGIKEKWPDNDIYWVTGAGSFDILKSNRLIDKIFIYSDSLMKELENVRFFKVINLEEDADVSRFASSLKGEKIGFDFRDGKVVPTKSAETWYNMSALGAAPANDILKKNNRKTWQRHMYDIIGINPSNGEYIFELSNEEREFGRVFARENGILPGDVVVGLNTGAGERWKLKRLPVEKTARLAERLTREFHAKVILLGGPEERERNKRILSSVPGLIDAGCDNSLLEFASIINQCGVVICSDSLALHFAIALKKKVVAFFGPTSPWEIELYGRGAKVYKESPCFVCYKQNGIAGKKCNEYITVDMILDGVKKVL